MAWRPHDFLIVNPGPDDEAFFLHLFFTHLFVSFLWKIFMPFALANYVSHLG